MTSFLGTVKELEPPATILKSVIKYYTNTCIQTFLGWDKTSRF